MTQPFWRTKSLGEMSRAEWESLCDGCGKCCLVLLEETGSGRLYETDVACKLFDVKRRRCKDYENRLQRVRDCVKLTPRNVAALDWMPETCAYRRLARGQDLPDWHPLVTGTRKSVEEAGVAVAKAVSERTISEDDIWDRVVAARARPRKRTVAASSRKRLRGAGR